MTTSLNPAQRRAVDLLRKPDVPPPAAPDGLIARLVTELETGLADLLPHLAGERLHVNKHALARIHACERHYLGTHTDFEWSPRTARGSVVHKAVQLTINWRGEPHPPDLVDEALAILADGDDGLAGWLGGAGEAARAELRSEAVDLVSAFQECFPPLKSSWRPVTETPVRLDLFDGLVRLTGRVDLTLGTHSGNRPGKVIVDLKTGTPAVHHRDDLRFYALLETARIGVPPRGLATYYLDAARVEVGRRHARRARLGTGPHDRRRPQVDRGPAAPSAPPWSALARCAAGAPSVPTARKAPPIWPSEWSGDDPCAQRSGSSLINAKGTDSPAAERTVAIHRPGCTAGFGSLTRSAPRKSTASWMEATVNASPQNCAGPPAGSGSGPPTTSSTTSPMRKNAWRIFCP